MLADTGEVMRHAMPRSRQMLRRTDAGQQQNCGELLAPTTQKSPRRGTTPCRSVLVTADGQAGGTTPIQRDVFAQRIGDPTEVAAASSKAQIDTAVVSQRRPLECVAGMSTDVLPAHAR